MLKYLLFHTIIFTTITLQSMEKENRNFSKKIESLFEEIILTTPDVNETYKDCMLVCWKTDQNNMKADLENLKAHKSTKFGSNNEFESCRYSCLEKVQTEIKKKLWKESLYKENLFHSKKAKVFKNLGLLSLGVSLVGFGLFTYHSSHAFQKHRLWRINMIIKGRSIAGFGILTGGVLMISGALLSARSIKQLWF